MTGLLDRGVIIGRRLARSVMIMVAAAALGLTAVLGAAAPAAAHNVLRSTNPADGAEIDRTPAQVVLTFDEPAIAMGTQFVITGPSGPVQSGSPRLVDNTVTQTLQPGSPAGRYAVSWRVTSADGHPITGEFGFTTKTAGTGTPGGGSTASPTAPIDAPAPVSPQSGPPGFVWVGIVVIIVAIGLLAWWVVRRRRTGSDPEG